jgi:LysM repeat protein
MQKLKFIVLALLIAASSSYAQNSELTKKYIETYREIAIEEMQRTGVPASIKLAQGIFETTAGTSDLVTRSSNHFGIKCKSNWTGESVRHDDDLKQECFRKYPSAQDSYRDHSNFLRQNSRYAFLFDLDPTDYRGWAFGLKKAGYATNTRYPVALIKIIEDYNLNDYTLIALGKKAPLMEKDPVIAASVSTEEKEELPAEAEADTVIRPTYPSGVFRIHDTRVVFVTKGSSYLAIAKLYDVDLSKIFEFNELTRTETAEYDQLVYLQRKRKTGSDEFHVVKPGESLHSISQQYAIRMESLRELNWLKEGEMPAAGEKLNLQAKSSSIPKLAVKEKYTLVPRPGKSTY